MASSPTPSFAHTPGEIILGVASHLSVSDLNALVQTAHRFHELLSQELYGRAPTLIRNDGDTPLIWAAKQGRVACVRKLVARDPDPARLIDGRAAIHDATAAGQEQTVAVLLDAGVPVSLPDKEGNTPLAWAVAHDQELVLRRLLASGAGSVAAPSKEDWEWGSALEDAVMRGHASMARILLEAGAAIAADHPAAAMIREAINSKLRLAAYQGQCEMITLLLEFGADAHLLRRGNLLPLHIAASHGHMDAVLLLLEHGADLAAVDEQGDATIHHAAAGGSVEVVKFLLDQGVPVGLRGDADTPVLLTAVIYRQAAVVRLLLEAGADVNQVEADGDSALGLAAYCGTVEIVESLLAHGAAADVLGPDDRTVLHVAVAGDNPDVVPSLCRAGAAINALDASGNTPLHLAALYERTAFARLLLEMGADLSIVPADGCTALHYASFTGQADLLQLLVDAGADVGALHRSGGHTALHYAAVQGSVDAFRVLLHAAEAQKLDLLSPCWCGGTILSKAATKGHRGIIELIVERGVDVTARHDGSSALHAAAAAGQTDLVEFLLSLGADPLQLDWFGRSAVDWAARHPPTLEKLAPPETSPLDEAKRTAALKEGITMLAMRALTEGKSASYRLGKCLLYINDVSAARMAFLYDAKGDPSVPDSAWAVCDLCSEKPAVTEGRYVCQTCPDIDLCGLCVDRYYQERLQIRLCDGHEFLEVQASDEELQAIQPKESRESWLHGLIAMYDSSR